MNPSPSPSVPFEVFCLRVLPLYSPPVRRKRTAELVSQSLREFAATCSTTGDITPASIAAWIADHAHRRSPIRAFALLRAFAAACRAGRSLGLVPADPFAFRPPRRWWPDGDLDPPERARHLTEGQARRLLAEADREAAGAAPGRRWHALRLATLVRVCLATGLRKSEALGLRVEDVDAAGGWIRVRPNRRRPLKTRASRRRLPVPAALAPHLEAWLGECGSEWLFPGATRSGPWSGGPPGHKPLDQVKALGRRAGIEVPVTILMLRHTYATAMEAAGAGELLLQRLLGHRRSRTQQGYRHEDEAALREAGEMTRT